MNWAAWLTIVGICLLGAMSPGPSLAVVLRNTLSGGRRNGVATALAHSLGVGFYAMICVSGLAFVITASPRLYLLLQWMGALYLAWLGVKGLMARRSDAALPEVSMHGAVRDGFMIVFLNPKIAVFFIALFSQVIGPDTPVWARLAYAATATVIDGAWYSTVAWLFSNPLWLQRLQRHTVWFERIFGAVLLGLAGKLALGAIKAA